MVIFLLYVYVIRGFVFRLDTCSFSYFYVFFLFFFFFTSVFGISEENILRLILSLFHIQYSHPFVGYKFDTSFTFKNLLLIFLLSFVHFCSLSLFLSPPSFFFFFLSLFANRILFSSLTICFVCHLFMSLLPFCCPCMSLQRRKAKKENRLFLVTFLFSYLSSIWHHFLFSSSSLYSCDMKKLLWKVSSIWAHLFLRK